MFAFTIKAFASTASFRIPENHTFQQTLPLPPVTTLTGLMGAAMGLDIEAAMNFRADNKISFGVSATYKGELRDLWKYNKVKTKETLKDVLIREFLVDYELTLVIASKDEKALSEINGAFGDPKYALTLGNSDDLLKIRRIGNIVTAQQSQSTDFENTVLPDIRAFEYESMIDLKDTPITYRVRAPQIYLLPTAFSFTVRQRRVSKREHFIFVGSPIRLKNPITAYTIDDLQVVLL
ncbi:MAG: CRISPR-associated protein Cas5 [Nitrospirae bacterium]|nr:CRISPR-associated protein Cas5 [Nitrospirota bacterium]MBF0591232.1 CRISPR-associated protein Cas5 [Nitrospirota bacterium]